MVQRCLLFSGGRAVRWHVGAVIVYLTLKTRLTLHPSHHPHSSSWPLCVRAGSFGPSFSKWPCVSETGPPGPPCYLSTPKLHSCIHIHVGLKGRRRHPGLSSPVWEIHSLPSKSGMSVGLRDQVKSALFLRFESAGENLNLMRDTYTRDLKKRMTFPCVERLFPPSVIANLTLPWPGMWTGILYCVRKKWASLLACGPFYLSPIGSSVARHSPQSSLFDLCPGVLLRQLPEVETTTVYTSVLDRCDSNSSPHIQAVWPWVIHRTFPSSLKWSWY